MKLTVLTENNAGANFGAEHGISYLIEIDGEKILFDTGHSNLFLKNAEQSGIDIHREVQKVVLSHGHWDHGNGLQFLKNKTLITHPEIFIKRFRKRNRTAVGLQLSRDEIQQRFNLILTRAPIKITEHLFFLGEIPRENDFEAKSTTFVDDQGNDDFVMDDSALAAVVGKKLVVITGCSHSGICNITEYAKKVTGISKTKAILGGFHLKTNNFQTQQTIKYFKNIGVENLFPSHCTEIQALEMFKQSFDSPQLKTGMILEF